MYIVLLGTPDSELEQLDFTAYGPFENCAAAARWVREREELVGVDALDTAIFVELSDPVKVLQELQE